MEKASVETIIDVYFAKEEFTKETTEKTGTHQYKFQNENKNIDKDKIATIIKKKVDEAIRKDKKYSKLDDIKAALTKTTYAKNEVISFDVYKLGSNLVKIDNAPLEEEIYIVAKTVLLEGKEVNIKIKEKEEILIAKAADLPIQEAKKDGAELTTLKATVEKGEAKIKIKLRPKSDEDLKKWKEKLAGIKDGQHTYTFGGKNDTSTDAKKKTVAGIIIKKIKDELAKNKKFAKSEDIVKALTNASYDKGEKITFDTYKVPTEYLWLQAECQGDVKKHEGEFLKKDGAYFEIGKKCECEAKIRAFLRMLRVGEGTGELVKSYDKKLKQTVYIDNDFQKGYTTAFGGNHIDDLSDHPRINYGGSTASGAYQVMGYTWDDTNFSKKRKDYGINSFSEENQDKFAILLLKEHPGCSQLIDLIISDQTEKAIRNCASRIWASLPEKGDNSRYLFKGKPQPVTPMKTILEHYETFLKDELKDISKLHLKKGFLKEFGYNCCQNGSTIVKVGYDIDKAVDYINSNAEPKSLSKCALYVRKAINAGGIKNLSGHAYEYYDTDKLVGLGFKKIGTDIDAIQLKKGDIVAFGAVEGHSYGHIAMYNGAEWVSDFKQKSFWVANQYSIEKKYSIYRWE